MGRIGGMQISCFSFLNARDVLSTQVFRTRWRQISQANKDPKRAFAKSTSRLRTPGVLCPSSVGASSAIHPFSAMGARDGARRTVGRGLNARALVASVLVAAAWTLPVQAVSPQNLPCGIVTREVVSGFGYATDFCVLDDKRTILLTKSGQAMLVLKGKAEVTEVLSMPEKLFWEGEMGLLSCAVDPDFANTRFVYLGYSAPGRTPGRPRTVISRFTYNTDVERIDPASEVILVGSCATEADCIEQTRPNHAVGSMEFGPDGYLYIAKGDGDGYEGENWSNLSYVGPHEIDDYLGKILRIDKNTGYGPLENPYCGQDVAPNSARCRVWASGVRNPWTFTFVPDAPETTMLAYDVGWYRTEAVKRMKKGTDGGWPCQEGRTVAYPPNNHSCTGTAPVFNESAVVYEYDHNGEGASIIGGAFFTNRFPTAYQNRVLAADYVRGTLFTLDYENESVYLDALANQTNHTFAEAPFATFALSVVKIKPGPDGTIWIMGLDNDGYVREISYNASAECPGMELPAGVPPSPPPPPVPSPLPTPPVTEPADEQCAPSWIVPVPDIPEGSQLTMKTYISNLPTLIEDYNGGWGPMERNINVGGPNAKDGYPITLAGTRYISGLGTRANSSVRVPIDGLCSEFHAIVGVDDVSAWGEATVQVFGDGTLLASGVVSRGAPPVSFDLAVMGMKMLTLTSTAHDGSEAVDVDWAEAVVYCGPKSPFLPRVSIQPSGGLDIAVTEFDTKLTFRGKAIDFQGKALPASAYDWTLNLIHCQGPVCHTHPQMAVASNRRGFTFKTFWHADCVSFEVRLKVKDDCGYESWESYVLRIGSAEPLCYPPQSGAAKRALAAYRAMDGNVNFPAGFRH